MAFAFARAGLLAGAAIPFLAGPPGWAAPSVTLSRVYQYQALSPKNVRGFGPLGVSVARNGTLYANTFQGGRYQDGTITRVTRGGQVRTINLLPLFSSDPTGPDSVDAGPAQGRILPLPDGSLIGAYTDSGFSGGTVFRVGVDEKSGAIIHRFACSTTPFTICSQIEGTANAGGWRPLGDTLLGADGALYGATRWGGARGQGVVYRLTLRGTFSVLHEFGRDTGPANGSLIQVADGSLIGTTAGTTLDPAVTPPAKPPPVNPGTVFRLGLDKSFRILHQFATSAGQAFGPTGGATIARDGYLWGLTTLGGADGEGAVYRLAQDGSHFSTVASFAGSDGLFPFQSALTEVRGKLWGVTLLGGRPGSFDGAIFSVDEATGTLTQAYAFLGNSIILNSQFGVNPSGTLALRSDGVLFGVASGDGGTVDNSQPDGGTIFGFKP